MMLAVSACPIGPVLAGVLVVLDSPGEICLAPSAANGLDVGVDCATFAIVPNESRGYRHLGTPCETHPGLDLCHPAVPVSETTWGGIKAVYR